MWSHLTRSTSTQTLRDRETKIGSKNDCVEFGNISSFPIGFYHLAASFDVETGGLCALRGESIQLANFSETYRRRRRIYSPNLHTKLKPIKNHVMDGYQKGHMAIQAEGLKKQN